MWPARFQLNLTCLFLLLDTFPFGIQKRFTISKMHCRWCDWIFSWRHSKYLEGTLCTYLTSSQTLGCFLRWWLPHCSAAILRSVTEDCEMRLVHTFENYSTLGLVWVWNEIIENAEPDDKEVITSVEIHLKGFGRMAVDFSCRVYIEFFFNNILLSFLKKVNLEMPVVISQPLN